MVDAVTTQTLIDGQGHLVLKFTNISDGTGESAVLKVDASTYTGMSATSRLAIESIQYMTEGMSVNILWDADTDVLALTIPQNQAGQFYFNPLIGNNAGTGITGDINFTTVSHSSGDRYVIILNLRKQP